MKMPPTIMIVGLVGLVLLSGYKLATHESFVEPDVPAVSIAPSQVTNVDPPALTQDGCEALDGAWNACGSACRGEEVVCIEMCVAQCECTGDGQCPAGHSCQEFIEEVGICKPV
jgi:hypothetical protein